MHGSLNVKEQSLSKMSELSQKPQAEEKNGTEITGIIITY